MRCGRAQRLMAAAVDAELTAAERAALAEHLGGCAACEREMATTTSLLAALDDLPQAAPVSMALELAMLCRVRLGAEQVPAHRRWWTLPTVPVLALAATVVLVISVVWLRSAGEGPTRVARTAPADVRVAVVPGERPRPAVVRDPPSDLPAVLARTPDLFMDLPILRHLEKLEHYESIQTTTLDEAPAVDGHDDGNG